MGGIGEWAHYYVCGNRPATQQEVTSEIMRFHSGNAVSLKEKTERKKSMWNQTHFLMCKGTPLSANQWLGSTRLYDWDVCKFLWPLTCLCSRRTFLCKIRTPSIKINFCLDQHVVEKKCRWICKSPLSDNSAKTSPFRIFYANSHTLLKKVSKYELY